MDVEIRVGVDHARFDVAVDGRREVVEAILREDPPMRGKLPGHACAHVVADVDGVSETRSPDCRSSFRRCQKMPGPAPTYGRPFYGAQAHRYYGAPQPVTDSMQGLSRAG